MSWSVAPADVRFRLVLPSSPSPWPCSGTRWPATRFSSGSLSRLTRRARALGDPAEWPRLAILVPAYNEEASIAGTLDSLLALDYPVDRREVVVMSDASTDRTDEIVRRYESLGVRLVRMSARKGKSAAENRTLPLVTCDIVVNTDATIRIPSGSLRPLIQVFQDPTVGAASGRDVSVGDINAEANASEAGYVGYEMGVRALETRLGGIIGASGCFYAIRRDLVDTAFPEELSRDFASPLRVRQLGYRTVSVDAALCIVPRARSLQAEYKRKIRTMLRGLNTLWYMRSLLNPLRYGCFAWMLASHKLARWLGFLTLPLAPIGLVAAGTNPFVGGGARCTRCRGRRRRASGPQQQGLGDAARPSSSVPALAWPRRSPASSPG